MPDNYNNNSLSSEVEAAISAEIGDNINLTLDYICEMLFDPQFNPEFYEDNLISPKELTNRVLLLCIRKTLQEHIVFLDAALEEGDN